MRRPLLLALFALSACGPGEVELSGEDTLADTQAALGIPGQDRPDTVDIGSWNVEWFGSTTQGPTDEALQQANVSHVLQALDLDLIGLEEVVSPTAFANVLKAMPGHDGLLVTDPRVEGGAAFYGPSEQKVALVFRRRFTVVSARVVLTAAQNAFGGRPPMEVTLKFTEGGKARTLVVLVAHFKAMANLDGYQRRTEAAAALKTYLDTTYLKRWVLVVGDFNDDLDVSTYRGEPSPFATLAADPDYRFTTAALTAAHIATTVHFPSTIDHHLATAALAQRFVAGSAQALKVDAFIPGYGTNTTDHYPVLTRYDLR